MTGAASALTSEINPESIRRPYLDALNRCFPGWGGDRQFAWCFDRAAGGPRADLIVLRWRDELVAGSAVTYRQLRLANENTVLAGIMTGSWTLPAARGRGSFSRMIQESVEVSRAAGAAVLLAFVTEENPSSRRLLAAGAAAFPTRYIFSGPARSVSPSAGSPVPVTVTSPVDLGNVLQTRQAAGLGHARVGYDLGQWRSQFLERAGECDLLRAGESGWCAVETVDRAVRLQGSALRPGGDRQALLRALISFAGARDRATFLFSMDGAMIQSAEAIGMGTKPGYLTALVADPLELARATGSGRPWSEADSRLLADPNSEWYLGPWFVESGDRM